MEEKKYPIFNTKELSDGNTYDLNNPADRQQYFKAKLGTKIEDLREYLSTNTFLGFLIAKKLAGKSTYSKLVSEVLGSDRFEHISVGDIVRDVDTLMRSDKERREVENYLREHYRGYISLDAALDAFLSRTQDKLVPTELILTLIKREVEKLSAEGKKALFLDGMPRNLDQISYSLFFRDLINYHGDKDFFVLIDTPETILKARMENRVVCPICKISRHLTQLPTSIIDYDKDTEEVFLVCDNKECSGYKTSRLVPKEGDDAGLESIRSRLDMDESLLSATYNIEGVSKVLLRNTIPVELSDQVEEYELKKIYVYDTSGGELKIEKKPWIIKDDDGVDSYSLMAATIVVSLLSQMHEILVVPGQS